MRTGLSRPSIVLAVTTLATALAAPPALAGPTSTQVTPDEKAAGVSRQLAAGVQVAPKGSGGKALPSDPTRGLVPDLSKVDFTKVEQQLAQKADAREARRQFRATAASPLLHDEREPAGIRGSNDGPATAERITGFGVGRGKNAKARILGQLSPEPVTTAPLAPVAEDNGSIPLAGATGIATARKGITTSGTIGDGPHGSTGTATGDFDFYALTDVKAGTQITADIDTPTGALDSVVGLYDAKGTLLAVNDDEGFPNVDSLLRFQFPADGDYFLLVSGFGFGTAFPADPFDPASGIGAGEEGPFNLTVTVGEIDADTFAVDLKAGDVIGGSVVGGSAQLSVHDSAGKLAFSSVGDFTGIYAPQSPLPGGGNAVVDYVVPRNGRYTIQAGSGSGRYDITLEGYRAGSELDARGTVQTLFVDFDGARVNTAIFGGPGQRQLSPLSGFLGRWGLSSDDEDAVIDAVLATIRENVVADLRAKGTNPNFAVRILNSRDHADPFGQPNVSRLVVGGTIAESGINTIGIAQSIDPGNYGHEETALILLDAVSDPAGVPYSFNTYLKPASNKIAFLGQSLGNVVSHEAGHYLGNWHVDQFNDVPSLMDQGGNFPVLYGVGADNIGGTADDVDVDFNTDSLNPTEPFTGLQDTLNTTAWGLTRGAAR
jgi:hypothetical protein